MASVLMAHLPDTAVNVPDGLSVSGTPTLFQHVIVPSVLTTHGPREMMPPPSMAELSCTDVSDGCSASSASPGFSARCRKVAISARVVVLSGQKRVPSPHPLVMPEAASRATSAAYHASSATSVKPGSSPSARP